MDANSRFLFKAFRKYYREYQPWLPTSMATKEFGFMFFDRDGMTRHMSFGSAREMKQFMYSDVPKHSYYSTAYYRRPSAPTMDEKGWMGAELIFDLDADHLEGADSMTYDEMMVQIRSEMIALVDDFLMGDLGFDEKDINLAFSGGRGYHAHISKVDVRSMDSNARRELVDYITCTGLDMDWVFPIQREASGMRQNQNGEKVANVKEFRTIPTTDMGGWRRRMRRGFDVAIEDICNTDPKVLKKQYPCLKGRSDDTLTNFSNAVKKARSTIYQNNDLKLLNKVYQDYVMEMMKEMSHSLSGEVDKPVTPDIKRLIRLPASVHGKTGLIVSHITRDQLTDYNPLEYAVPSQYSDDPVRIVMKRDYELKMLGQRFSLKKGEVEVPEYAAVFLIGRKEADHILAHNTLL